jgi:hypothetical protein
VHLIDGASSTYVWSDAVDGSIGDPIALQERVATAVRAQFAGGLRERSRPVANLAAERFYRQGRYHLDQRRKTGSRAR